MVLATKDRLSEIANVEIANPKTSVGHKMTEFGLIPEDWYEANLGDKTIKIGSGITPTGGERIYKQSGRPFLRSQNIANGHLLLDAIAYIDEETHESFKSTEVKIGDVLLNITGASIGRCAVADQRVQGGNVNQHVCIIRTNKNELDFEFLKYFLLSSAGQSQIDSFQAGGNREGLNFGQIRSFTLPCPSLKEQKTIAAALKDIDSLINGLNQLLVKKLNIKLAAMQQLLTGKQRLQGFSTDWKLKRFGDVLKVRHGRSQKEVEIINGKYPILASGGEIGRTNHYLYDKPSVLIGRKGTIDSPQYIEIPFWTVDTLFFTEISNCAFPKFIFYKFNMIHWRTYSEASGVPSLNASTIERVEFSTPNCLEEQIAIAKVLTDIDTELFTLEQQLAKVRNLKQGMMQELLTGRIRLT